MEELNLSKLKPQIVSMVVTLAMERKPSQREMTSVLISDMYGPILKCDDIAAGFSALLENLSDLILDTPDAATVSQLVYNPNFYFISSSDKLPSFFLL